MDSICPTCGKKITDKTCYKSGARIYNHLGFVPFCKDCIYETYERYLNDFKDERKAVYVTCRIYNIPYSDIQLEGALRNQGHISGYAKIFKTYMKNINSLGVFNGESTDISLNDVLLGFYDRDKVVSKDTECNFTSSVDLPQEKLKELAEVWGNGYTPKQYLDLEKFYKDMKMTHSIVTPQHIKALMMLCKMQLKLDKFLEENDMTSFAKLHDQYQKLLQSSGLRPIDKVGGDEATGMRSFSHIFEEVEKDGYIPPKKYKTPQDIIDSTIMYVLNYTKKLIGQQPMVEPPSDTPKVSDLEGERFE